MSDVNVTEELAAINAKLDLIIATVEQTVGALASHPMIRNFLK